MKIILWSFAIMKLLAVVMILTIAQDTAHAQQSNAFTNWIYSQTNQERVRNGHPPMRLNNRLIEAAKQFNIAQVNPSNSRQRQNQQKFNDILRTVRYDASHTALIMLEAPPQLVQDFKASGALAIRAKQEFDKALVQSRKYQQAIKSNSHEEIGIALLTNSINGKDRALITVIFASPKMPYHGAWQQEVMRYVNQFRREYGLKPLRLERRLTIAADDYSKRMALGDFFAHGAPEGDFVDNRVQDEGYSYRVVLENLQGGAINPREAVDEWIASKKGHREAMLHKDITEMGIGYYFLPFDEGRSNYSHYWTLIMANPR